MVIRVDGSHEMAVTRGGGSLFALNQKLPLEAVSRKACGYGYCFHMGYLHKLLSGEAKISSKVIFCATCHTIKYNSYTHDYNTNPFWSTSICFKNNSSSNCLRSQIGRAHV